MKTKTHYIELILTALLMIAFFSCAKSSTSNHIIVLIIAFLFCKNDNASNKNQNNKPGALNDNSNNTTWDGVNGNKVESVFSPNAITSSISPSFSTTFVYSFGEVISTGITSVSTSTYKKISGYRYGSGWQAVNTGKIVLTLLNGNIKFFMNIKNNKASEFL